MSYKKRASSFADSAMQRQVLKGAERYKKCVRELRAGDSGGSFEHVEREGTKCNSMVQRTKLVLSCSMNTTLSLAGTS